MTPVSEGVDPDGFIRTSVAAANIGPDYAPIVADCVAALTQALGDDLLGVYVTGSVATGRAVPPGSDIDMVALVADEADRTRVDDVATRLTARFSKVVREVGLGAVARSDVFADDLDGIGWRCFLRHYCVCVAGHDLGRDLAPCRAGPAVALAFTAGIGDAVGGIIDRLRRGPGPGETAAIGAKAARQLLLAAAPLASVLAGTWTTDRAAGAMLIVDLFPERADEARTALAWYRAGTASGDVGSFVESFGVWVARDLRRLVERMR